MHKRFKLYLPRIIHLLTIGLIMLVILLAYFSFNETIQILFHKYKHYISDSTPELSLLILALLFLVLSNIVKYIHNKYNTNNIDYVKSMLLVFYSLSICYIISILIVSKINFGFQGIRTKIINNNFYGEFSEFIFTILISFIILGIMYCISDLLVITSYLYAHKEIPYIRNTYNWHQKLLRIINYNIKYYKEHGYYMINRYSKNNGHKIFLLIIILMTIFICGIGVGVTLTHVNGLPEWIDALATVLGSIIATMSLLFAVSIFNRHYVLDVNSKYNSSYPGDWYFVVDFINKSRISASAKFLGIILNNKQIHQPEGGGTIAINAFQGISKYTNENQKKYSKKSKLTSSKYKRYIEYVDLLNNVKAHNSISFEIPFTDLVFFINHNKYWNKRIHNIINSSKRNEFRIRFAFVDYNNKLICKDLIIDSGYFNYIKKNYKSYSPISVC